MIDFEFIEILTTLQEPVAVFRMTAENAGHGLPTVHTQKSLENAIALSTLDRNRHLAEHAVDKAQLDDIFLRAYRIGQSAFHQVKPR